MLQKNQSAQQLGSPYAWRLKASRRKRSASYGGRDGNHRETPAAITFSIQHSQQDPFIHQTLPAHRTGEQQPFTSASLHP